MHAAHSADVRGAHGMLGSAAGTRVDQPRHRPHRAMLGYRPEPRNFSADSGYPRRHALPTLRWFGRMVAPTLCDLSASVGRLDRGRPERHARLFRHYGRPAPPRSHRALPRCRAEPGRRNDRDLMAATMTNQLLDALGQRPTQSGSDAKRLRERRLAGLRPPSTQLKWH